MLRFSDGVEIDTDGPPRAIILADGMYVVGDGTCCPVGDWKEAEEVLDWMRRAPKAADDGGLNLPLRTLEILDGGPGRRSHTVPTRRPDRAASTARAAAAQIDEAWRATVYGVAPRASADCRDRVDESHAMMIHQHVAPLIERLTDLCTDLSNLGTAHEMEVGDWPSGTQEDDTARLVEKARGLLHAAKCDGWVAIEKGG